jgi:translation elongation factor EF-G
VFHSVRLATAPNRRGAVTDAIADYLPSPIDEGDVEGSNPANGEPVKRAVDPNAPFSAYVFKTVIDPFAGKLSIMRVMSGRIAPDMTCLIPNRQLKEKTGHLFRLEGKKQEAVKDAVAGEIVAAAKFKDVGTGDTLCDEKAPIRYPGIARFSPNISFALEPKSKADEDKLPQGLHRIMEKTRPSRCTATTRPAISYSPAWVSSISRSSWKNSNASTAPKWFSKHPRCPTRKPSAAAPALKGD